MPDDNVTRPRAKGNVEPRQVKACFRFAHPEKGDGALHWVPDDFPAVFGDKHLTLVDNLIMRLITARNDLYDPARGPDARSLIDRIVQAIGAFDPNSMFARHELIVKALDGSARPLCSPVVTAHTGVRTADGGVLEGTKLIPNPLADLTIRVWLAESTIRAALPSAKLPPGVLRRAVELWPETKQREARKRAVRELARALDCDVPSLTTMLRQARGRLREQKVARRAKRRTT